MRRRAAFLAAFACIASASAALADPPTVTDPTKPPPPSADKPKDQPPSPWSLTLAYTGDFLANLSGGASKGRGYADLFKASEAYDGSQAGHDGLSGLVSVEHTFGSGFTANRVGAVQAISSTEAQPQATRLYEAWLQQDLAGGMVSIKGGLIDLNTTFDVQETATLFLNGSDGAGADLGDTGLNGPSIYPIPALGATFAWRPTDDWTAQLGLFDGVAGDPAHRSSFVAVRLDGALVIGQVERRFGDAARVELGLWAYTNAFPSLVQTTSNGVPRPIHSNNGVYALAEGRLMQTEAGGGLSGWVRLGFANGDINTVENYLGAGLVYSGLLKGRDKDQAGIAFSRAAFGSGACVVGLGQGRSIGPAETTLEATYRYVVNDWLNVQPDTQIVFSPHGDRNLSTAWVVGFRVAITYSP